MFTHSVRLVMNNFGSALRISALLYGVQSLAVVYAHVTGINEVVEGPMGFPVSGASADQGIIYMLLSFAAVVASLWIAVSWHRYVLLSEEPKGWLPAWPGGKVFGYLGRSILIALALMLVLVPVGFLTSVLGIPDLTIVISIGIGAYFFFRLSPILPAISVGKDMKIRDAFNATKDGGSTLLGLAGLMIAGTLITQLPTMLSGDPNSLLSLVYGIVVNWFAMIIGVSLLTTVYGHYVEKREIV
jgi:hypothetical protein